MKANNAMAMTHSSIANNLQNGITFLIKRCIVLYAIAFVILRFGVDYQSTVFKRMDYLQNMPSVMIEFAQDQSSPIRRRTIIQALFYYKTMLKIFKESGLTYSAIAFCHYHLGEYDKAVQFYNQAILKEPGFFGLHHNLGIIHMQQGEYEQAIQSFEKAVSTRPDQTIAYARFVDPYRNAQQAHWSKIDLKVVSGIQQGYAKSYQMIVHSYELMGNYEKMLASSLGGIASAIHGRDFFYHKAGVAAAKLGRDEEAITYLRECIKINPTYVKAYDDLALSFARLNLGALAKKIQAEKERLGSGQLKADEGLMDEPTALYFYIPTYQVSTPDGKSYIKM